MGDPVDGCRLFLRGPRLSPARGCPSPSERAQWLARRVLPARRLSIQTPLWRPSALATTAPEEGQMRIEDRALAVSAPDSGPRLRLGRRPDGGRGRW